MQRFEHRPDPVFTAIPHEALGQMQDWIDEIRTDPPDEQQEWWRSQYPHTAVRFTPEAARAVTEALLVASHRPRCTIFRSIIAPSLRRSRGVL